MSRKVKWELALQKVDELVGQNNGNLFDRVRLLKQVWEDTEFLAFHNGVIDAAEEHLNTKLGDYGLSFFDCLALLAHKTSRLEWEKGNLREMLAEAIEANSPRKSDSPPTVRKGAVPRKEYEELEKQMKHMNSRADSLAEENGRLRAENERFEAELSFTRASLEATRAVSRLNQAQGLLP